MRYLIFILLFLHFIFPKNENTNGSFTISRIHYGGGGDWYADPSSIPNLLGYISNNTNIKINPNEIDVKIGDENFNINNYFYMTGHGNIKLSSDEQVILRRKLINGAFLHADDNYGMDKSFRKLIKDLFPEKDLVEIPASHELFNIYFQFPEGLPKIHEHDNKRPQALGIFHNERLVLLYTYESDLGDGWEDKRVHDVPEYKRESALKMGTNIIIYSLLR
tara:strand:+ start:454 stop:1113 length:660 start_codon:yes stop_codon:yes gene_type:complete